MKETTPESDEDEEEISDQEIADLAARVALARELMRSHRGGCEIRLDRKGRLVGRVDTLAARRRRNPARKPRPLREPRIFDSPFEMEETGL